MAADMSEQNPDGATVPCIDLFGLSVMHREDGCWMRFRASDRLEASINLSAFANERRGIIGTAILQWIESVRPNDEGDSGMSETEKNIDVKSFALNDVLDFMPTATLAPESDKT